MFSWNRLVKKSIAAFVPIIIQAYFAAKFTNTLFKKKKNPSLRVVLLNKDRFREDIFAIDDLTEIELMAIPDGVHEKINALSECCLKISVNGSMLDPVDYFCKFIPYFCEFLEADCFLSCGMYYARNEYWEKASVKTHTPFICQHREGIGFTKEEIYRAYDEERVLAMRRFFGHEVIFVTENTRIMFVDRGYISAEKTRVSGLPRMDYLTKKMCSLPEEANPAVTLFSFYPSLRVPRELLKDGDLYFSDYGFNKLFIELHGCLAKFSLETGIPVIIKPKWYEGKWKDLIDYSVVHGSGKKPEEIPNLSIIDNVSAQEIIARSAVAIGFNSTTMIETLLLGKVAILPCFKEASGHLSDYVQWKDYRHNFLTASSAEELINIIGKVLDGSITSPFVREDNALVKEVFGSVEGLNSVSLERNLLEIVRDVKGKL